MNQLFCATTRCTRIWSIEQNGKRERERTKKYSHIVRLSIFAGCITAVVSQHVSVFAISRFIAAIGRPVRPCLHGHEVSWKKRTSVRVEYSITKQHIEIERTMYIYRLAYIYIYVCVWKRGEMLMRMTKWYNTNRRTNKMAGHHNKENRGKQGEIVSRLIFHICFYLVLEDYWIIEVRRERKIGAKHGDVE